MSTCGKSLTKGAVPLEDEEEHNERVLSHYIVYFTQFTVIISYSTILAGLWPYLNKLDPTAGKTFLGYLISASALGQTIFSPLIGYCSNKLQSTRLLFIVTILINVISFCIHASCESFPLYHRKYWLLFSRFLAGTGAANVTICRSHISTTTLLHERRKAVSILSSSSTVALGLGAALQLMLVPLGDGGFWLMSKFKFDMYTSVAWILLAMSVINLCMFLPSVFKEHNMLTKEQVFRGRDTYSGKDYKTLAIIFIAMNFIVVFNSLFPKVLGTPLSMDEFAMSRKQAVTLNSIVMCVGAAISFITVFVVNPLCSLLSEMKVLVIGLLIFVAGRIFFYPFGDEPAQTFDDISYWDSSYDINERIRNTTVGCPLSQTWCATERKLLFFQFILGNVFESIGYTITTILTLAIFSKVLGSKKQGTWMGFLTSAGSVARVCSPIFISFVYVNLGPSVVTLVTNFLFAVTSFSLVKYSNYLIVQDDDICDMSLESEQAAVKLEEDAEEPR